jgi:murein DD-endopeptidase MepM/ murein hydrolase activator NlpD
MNTEAQFLGELSPLRLGPHNRRPERREVSKRWLASCVLVGVTSSLLMGGALFAALEGREKLTLPAQAYERAPNQAAGIRQAVRSNHPGLFAKIGKEQSNIIMASTISRDGDLEIVKAKPFMKLTASMAIASAASEEYPAFNALAVFSGNDSQQEIAKSNGFLYGAEVESEVALNVVPFPFDELEDAIEPRQRSADILAQVRQAAVALGDNTTLVSAIAYFDTERFSGENQLIISNSDVTITAENVSILQKTRNKDYQGPYYDEQLIEVTSESQISDILKNAGLGEADTSLAEQVLASDLGTSELREGDTLQAWFRYSTDSIGQKSKSLAKISIYRGTSHLVSVARTDDDRFVYAVQPESPDELIDAAEAPPKIPKQNLPSIYDGIYRAALSQGLPVELAGSLIRIFAFDVDFKSRVGADDELEVFLSLEDGQSEPGEGSEILYAGLKSGKTERRYYRFQDEETGYVDYYDETGKSAKKFLLRQPVPNGRFRSAFGMRRHPISRVYKLHGGVDWAAPRGTPIVAAGNGVVEKAGWRGGNGRFTSIRHANGYETSYSHQYRFAKGIKPGVRVRQGQIIGYVGSTGYSTGPHLHYEVKVNGNRVDPMRIKLPKGKVLKDAELARFEAERDRIDALVHGEDKQLTAALN